jgi:hypothetical protein
MRDAVALAAAFVAQALCSGYLLVLTAVALVASALSRPAAWIPLKPAAVRRALLLCGSAIAATLLLLPFLLPYVRVRGSVGLVRPLDEIARYSAKPLDYLTTVARVHFDTWSGRIYVPGTDALFAGGLALILMLIAVGSGTAWLDRRARMLLFLGVAGFALSFGPAMPGYSTLYETVPLFQGIRGAARFGYLAIVGVAGLAAFGLAQVSRTLGRQGRRPRTFVAVASTAAIVIVNVEAWTAPLDLVRFDGVSPVYATLDREATAVVAEFPFPPVEHVARNSAAVLAAAYHRKPLVNGYSGFTPPSYARNAKALAGFPDQEALAHLHRLGVTHVVVHFDAYDDPAGTRRAVEGFGDLRAASGSVAVYRLR